MEKIRAEKFLDLLKSTFCKICPYLDSFSDLEIGIHTQMSPFVDYTVDVIKSKDHAEMKKIFDFVELLLCNGDEAVQNAIATSFLESLLSESDLEAIDFTKFVNFMGKESIDYCKGWDEFTGCRTKGLWDEKTVNKWKEARKNKKLT